MWWRILLFKLGLKVGRRYLRDDRERLIIELTKGDFDPLQQALLNILISKIIDTYIGEEDLLDYIPGNYYNYIKKLMLARKIVEAVIVLINIRKIHSRESDAAMLEYRKQDDYSQYKKIDDIKNDVLVQTDRLADINNLKTTTPDVEIHSADLDKSVRSIV